MLLHGRGEHRRDESRHAHRRGERDRRADGIALLRHRRRAAAARRRRLERLAHFGLREQRQIARELAERRGERCPARSRTSHRRSRCVCHGMSATPRSSSRASAVVDGEAARRRATRACRRRRRTARRARAAAAPRGARDGDRARASTPASFRPSVTGDACCSHVRPAQHRVAMRVAPAWRAHRARRARSASIERERIAQLQHEPGVDDVLAGRAPVHVAARLGVGGGDAARQRGDQRNREVAGVARLARQRGDVEIVGAAALRRSQRGRGRGMTPTVASARASAASKSSIRCTRARRRRARASRRW